MAFYTDKAKKYKFPSLPDNKGGNSKEAAFARGFMTAIAGSGISAAEKVAWFKFAAEQLPPPGGQPGGEPPLQPVEGPGPGLMPEGGPEAGGAGPGDEEIQEILASLPGNTAEEKLQSAVMLLASQGAGGQPGGPEEGGPGMGGPGGPEGAGLPPELMQQLMSGMQGGQAPQQ